MAPSYDKYGKPTPRGLGLEFTINSSYNSKELFMKDYNLKVTDAYVKK